MKVLSTSPFSWRKKNTLNPIKLNFLHADREKMMTNGNMIFFKTVDLNSQVCSVSSAIVLIFFFFVCDTESLLYSLS